MVGIMVRFFSTLYVFLLHGFLGVDTVEVSVPVMEGDPVILHTGVKANQQGIIRWYFNNIRIAQINGDQSFICTDVRCNAGTERFRDRMELNHQTGSLTIRDIRTTDSGDYELDIFSSSSSSQNIFKVSVRAVPDSGLSSAVPDSGLSSAAVAGICVAVLLVAAAADLTPTDQ